MENYRDCVALNAKAISLIQAGSCEEGIETLTRALVLLQPFLQYAMPSGIGSRAAPGRPPPPVAPPVAAAAAASVEVDTTDTDTSASIGTYRAKEIEEQEKFDELQQESQFKLPAYFSVPVTSADDCESQPLISSDDQLFTFYNRMFEITETDILKNLGVSKTFVLLLFNFAMAHHIHAARHHIERQEATPTRQLRLAAIVQMYQSVTLAAKSSLNAEEVGSILCVIIAATNNAGHLHSFLHNFEQIQSSLHLQLQLIGLSYGPCAIPKVDCALLFSSVYAFFEGPGLCLPPAA